MLFLRLALVLSLCACAVACERTQEKTAKKPDAAAFGHVLERHDADPTRTLFIDDSEQHVVGARSAGLHAEHLDLVQEDILGLCERLDLL